MSGSVERMDHEAIEAAAAELYAWFQSRTEEPSEKRIVSLAGGWADANDYTQATFREGVKRLSARLARMARRTSARDGGVPWDGP